MPNLDRQDSDETIKSSDPELCCHVIRRGNNSLCWRSVPTLHAIALHVVQPLLSKRGTCSVATDGSQRLTSVDVDPQLALQRLSGALLNVGIYRECVTAFDTLFSIEQPRIPEPCSLPPACNRLLNSGCVHGPPPLTRGESLPNATALLTSYQ